MEEENIQKSKPVNFPVNLFENRRQLPL